MADDTKHRSLRNRLILYLVLFSLLLASVLSGLSFYFSYKKEMNGLQNHLQQIENSFLKGITQSVWIIDKQLAQIQIEGIQALPDIAYVEIITDGEVFVSSGNLPTSEDEAVTEYPLIFSMPDKELEIGKLKVFADLNYVYSMLFDQFFDIILFELVFILIIIVLISQLFNRLILQHLEKLSQFMQDSTWENLDEEFALQRTDHKYEDELDIVVNAYNAQQKALKKTHKKLSISETRYLELAENSIQGIWIHIDFKLVYVNDACARIFGYKNKEELLRIESILQLIEPYEIERVRRYRDERIAGKPAPTEYEFDAITKHGKSIHLLQTATVIDWEGNKAILNTYTDITSKKQAENALKLSEEKFSKAFMASPYPIIITRIEDDVVIEVNDAYTIFFGYERDELISHHAIDTDIYVDPADKEKIKTSLNTRGIAKEFEIDTKTKSGDIRHCFISVDTVNIQNQDCMIFIVYDITDRKLAEQEVLNSRERLRKLANRLEEIREEERIGISREIHDELGQALTGIKIDLTWLQDSIPPEENTREKMNQMITSIDNTVDIVRRISSNLRPPVLDDLGLEAAIEWYTNQFYERTRIKPVLNLDCEELNMDKNRDTAIFRIYQEALTNIARHSQATSFETDVRIVGDEIKLSIKDNGIGITEEQINANQSIGLIGMQERAKIIDASVIIKNAPNGGTLVELTVPRSPSIRHQQ